MDTQGGKLHASFGRIRSDTATVLHTPSLNEGCVCLESCDRGVGVAGAWPGEQPQSSLTSWSCDWE